MSFLVFLGLTALSLAVQCPDDSEHAECTDCDANGACTTCTYGSTKVEGRCFATCTYNDPSNQYYQEHCVACSHYNTQGCAECEDTYWLTSSMRCEPMQACDTIPAAHCDGCNSYGMCVHCEAGYKWDLVAAVCSMYCDNFVGLSDMYTKGCLRCDKDNSRCVSCNLDSHYWSPEYEGTCIPKGCGTLETEGSLMCNGHGTCRIGTYGAYECLCDSETRSSAHKCGCAPGYKENDNKECEPIPCPDGLYPNCKSCLVAGTRLECTECVPGMYDMPHMCEVPWPYGCQNFVEYGTYLTCNVCLQGYEKASYWEPVGCFPKVNVSKSQQASMPNCAWANSAGRCIGCKYGYENPDGNCDIKCEAGPYCARCDPNDPTVCLDCIYGQAPYCLPTVIPLCATDYYPDVSGVCLPKACMSVDFGYYDYYYGQVPGRVACSGHGTCETEGTPRCVCTDNYDPDSNCFSCLPGYVRDLEGAGCIPDEGDCGEHCASCVSGRCTSCRSGWSNIDKGCDTRCTVIGCAFCSPNDPTDCLACAQGSGTDSSGIAPPCQPVCDGSFTSCTLPSEYPNYIGACAFTKEGEAVCMPSRCVPDSYSGGLHYECSHHGKCDMENNVCICDEGWTGAVCSVCSNDYRRDPITNDCVKEVVDECPETCSRYERCLQIDGVYACYSTYCLNGDDDKLCNGIGTCLPHGVCDCKGPHFNVSTACKECEDGYSLEGNKCVKDDCTSGAHQVVGCIKCKYEGSKICDLCESDTMPTNDNHCLNIPPASTGGPLSSGAIAGIVIAVIVILAVAAFLIYWFGFRKSKSSKSAKNVPIADASSNSL